MMTTNLEKGDTMTTNNSEKDRVLARVKKMLNLANDAGASEGERDNALRMAHATLAKHNLSMAEASQADTSRGEARIEETAKNIGYPWARQAAHAVAGLFFCKYFYMDVYTATGKPRSDACRHFFVGRESNATTAREMAIYVLQSILREANRRRVAEQQTWTWHTSFCKGAAARVRVRCSMLRDEAEKADAARAAASPSSGTSLVLASLYALETTANEAFIASRGRKLGVVQSREHAPSVSGYADGAAFGNSISLNRQVGTGSSTARLK
jgi:hypothetical protein